MKDAAKILGVPLITGSTSHKKRDSLYRDFKDGTLSVWAGFYGPNQAYFYSLVTGIPWSRIFP
jgi:hypothetical protein